MIKQRLKDLEIKITELADYLQISRPTLYKYIEDYDSGKKKDVNPKICSLFDFMENNELIGKRNVIQYILTNLTEGSMDMDDEKINRTLASIRSYVTGNPESEKTQFLRLASETGDYDIAIHYLIEIRNVLKKERKTQEDKDKLRPYQEILALYDGSIKEENKDEKSH